MTQKVLSEEPVTTDASGNPILGYRLKKDMLAAFVKQVRDLTQNQCLFATKEEGDMVNVVVIPCGDKPSAEFLEGMARLESDVATRTLLTAEFSATNLEFGTPPAKH
jgi:hypothetical protein